MVSDSAVGYRRAFSALLRFSSDNSRACYSIPSPKLNLMLTVLSFFLSRLCECYRIVIASNTRDRWLLGVGTGRKFFLIIFCDAVGSVRVSLHQFRRVTCSLNNTSCKYEKYDNYFVGVSHGRFHTYRMS